MERIVLRHLTGSKANQVEEFPLSHFNELVIGRDPSSTVKYDPDRDDLVGRQHAKITRDPANQTEFFITDLGSRNGTFVNKQRIVGTAKVAPGDVVQFGPGGPEFQFDLEPRPANAIRTTRIATDASASAVPPTRVGNAPLPVTAQAYPGGVPMTGSAPGGSNAIGKATVERMMAQQKSHTTRNLILASVALIVIAGAIAGGVLYFSNKNTEDVAANVSKMGGEAGATKSKLEALSGKVSPMTPAEVAAASRDAVVYLEVSWHLIYTPTGSLVYQVVVPNKKEDGSELLPGMGPMLPVFVRLPDGTIEPDLTLNNGIPIGTQHTGSGFVVSANGFILTNRHVAATWETSYFWDPSQYGNGGIMYVLDANYRPAGITPIPFQQMPNNWVPSNSRLLGRKPVTGKVVEGRHDYLDVTFAGTKLRKPAHLVGMSDRHDVAMVKIDVPNSMKYVELEDTYDSIKQGDAVTVMGYPGVAPKLVAVTTSKDPFNRGYQDREIPDPTLSTGNIGRVLRGQENPSGDKDPIYSMFGDAYQLTINSTGSGNSGGPLFNDRGKVTGIFFASARRDVTITFAVPIKFGMEIMGTSR